MKTNNNYDTIGLIISLILSDNFLASVESLAEACDLPIQQMRKYLSVIFDNKNLLTHLSPTPEADDENEDNNFIETASTFLSAILSGNADTNTFTIDAASEVLPTPPFPAIAIIFDSICCLSFLCI